MKPSLDIVVVNWNAGPLLRACLGSIEGALGDSFELQRVVVVDNASTDDSLAGLGALGLPLVVIANAENRGFGRACNQGARESRADYVLFLNPDTRLFEASLCEPIAHLERPENAEVGVCGVRLVDAHGRIARSCARFPTSATFAWMALGIDRLRPCARLGYRMSDWAHDATRDVDHVMGAFYLIRGPLFRDLGGFDEEYFVYFEDLDLSRRVRATGYRSRYLASASAYHLGGGTSRRIKARRLAYFLRGKLRYARKHGGGLGLAATALATFAVEPFARTLGALLAGSPSDALATLRGYAWMLRPEPGAALAPVDPPEVRA